MGTDNELLAQFAVAEYLDLALWVGHKPGTDHLLDADLRASATQAVERFDDLLRSFTEPDERGVVRRFSPDDADTDGQEWWWGRIPTSGPVREELESWWVRISPPGPVREELG